MAPTWSRITSPRKWIVTGIAAILLLLIAGGSAILVTTEHPHRVSSSTPTTSKWTAIQQWWSGASADFATLRDSSDAAQHAIDHLDPIGLETACQQIHDDAEVKMKTHLPSPEPELTAELSSAIEDYHDAAHMCLAVTAGSANSYNGEFKSYLEQADLHMKAAQNIINQTLIET